MRAGLGVERGLSDAVGRESVIERAAAEEGGANPLDHQLGSNPTVAHGQEQVGSGLEAQPCGYGNDDLAFQQPGGFQFVASERTLEFIESGGRSVLPAFSRQPIPDLVLG